VGWQVGYGYTILGVRLIYACLLTSLALPAAAGEGSRAPAAAREIARRAFGAGQLRLVVDPKGMGTLLLALPGSAERAVPCDPLEGAWGLWIGDLEDDGAPEVIVTLRKTAKHDPVLENRLHVYAIENGRCVPLWRGTRLAGRFERIAIDRDRVLALERVPGGRRVVWYRWHGFGYRLEEILWQGRGLPGPKLKAMFAGGKDP
jgi:hypothetical protein